MEIRLPPDIERSILAAFDAGDYERVANQLADAVLRANPIIIGTEIAAIEDHVDIEELSQDVPPFDASSKADAGCWPKDESVDDFLTFIRSHREEAITPTVEQ